MFQYRLLIPPQPVPELRLYDLCRALRRHLTEPDGTLSDGAAVAARATSSGGFEVRMTWPAARCVAVTQPTYYIEEVGDLDDRTQWTLYVGTDEWHSLFDEAGEEGGLSPDARASQ